MKITRSQLKQIIKEEMETALNNPRTDELKAALEVSYRAAFDTNLDPQEAAADILTVVEEFLSDKLGMPIELRY